MIALLAMMFLLLPTWAAANGRFPNAQQVVIGPGPTRSDVIVLRATFGLLLSTDGGRSFRWVCEEGLYYPFVPALNYDPAVELSARGTVVFSYEEGVRFVTNGCGAEDVRGTQRRAFTDMTSNPDGSTIFAVRSSLEAPSSVYRIDGVTLEVQSTGMTVPDVVFDTIEVAPSNAQRLYLTGRAGMEAQPVFYRSDDGGQTLTRLMPDAGAADSLWVSGIDPRDPDTLYVRAAVGLNTELRRSRDGGRSFQRVASVPEPMLGFAISDDGRTIWIGGATSGLLRSDDGGESFGPVNRLPVHCLRQHAGVLWACSDWTTQPFTLGRSQNGGMTFEPVLQITNDAQFQGPPECTMRSEGAEICVDRWLMLQRTLQNAVTFIDAGVRTDAGRPDVMTPRDGGFDGGRMDVPPLPDSGVVSPPVETCGCRVPGGSASPSGLAVFVALFAWAGVRRKRSRRQAALFQCERERGLTIGFYTR
jgi:MYXO-CTERM domain-containing protein